MRFFALFVYFLASSTRVNAHGTLTKVQVKRTQQTACAVNAKDPECSPSQGVSVRSVISREAGQACSESPSSTCSNEHSDCCAIPGDPTDYYCDHCGLERVVYTASMINNQRWWTNMPAIYWDLPAMVPTKTCMSNDGFGDRGTISVSPGDTLSTAWYVNADHSGLYRFELSCGEDALEADFMANPLTPWKALHRSKELAGSDQLPESRDVGSTRAATDAYYRDRTVCTGTGCDGVGPALWSGHRHMNPSTQAEDSSYCRNNRASCFIEDEIVIPFDTQCSGSATLRWKWNSAEGKEIYAACVDLNIGGAPIDPVPQPPQPQPEACTVADVEIWATGIELLCCQGLNQCLEDRSQDSPLYAQYPEILMCRSHECGESPQTTPTPQPEACTVADVEIWATGVELPCCQGLNQCLEDRSQDSPLFAQFPKIIMCRSQACVVDPSTAPPTDPETTADAERVVAVASSCDKTRVTPVSVLIGSTLAFFFS